MFIFKSHNWLIWSKEKKFWFSEWNFLCKVELYVLSISFVSGGAGIFIIEGQKEKMIMEKITGIRFMKPNEK